MSIKPLAFMTYCIYMDESFYSLGFSYFEGIGPKKYAFLLKEFGTAKAAWNATNEDHLRVLGKTFGPRFIAFRDTFDFDEKQEELESAGAWFVDVGSSEYPHLLREIPNPPIVLFGIGDKTLLTSFKERYIGVVGTRKITSYGIEVTTMMVEQLVTSDYCIVSGLALGVDALAHKVALENEGKTIAVLGCGVNRCYPQENERIYKDIIEKGSLIISEFPLGVSPTPGSFPSRNRIIAGISASVLVTQGALGSGSLITASNAVSLHRPVFAVPGPITSSLSHGTNELLKEGAIMVSNANDIMKGLGKSLKTPQRQMIKGDTALEQSIIDLLIDQAYSFDEFVKKIQLSVQELGSLLSVMEMKGFIKRDSEGNFILV